MSELKKIRDIVSKSKASNTLDLTGIKINTINKDIKEELDKLKKVQILVLAECSLQNLDNLPAWKLAAVDFSKNQLDDKCLAKLVTYPNLTQIILLGNKVENLDSLKQLAVLKNLNEVDFSQNPVAANADYRSTLFNTISSLEIVDLKDKNNNQIVQEPEDVSEEYQESDESFEEDEDDDEYEEDEESSDKPRKKRK